MKSKTMPGSNHISRFKDDDRGQLLLLSAVAIVIIVLATITLVNTAGFTEREQADGVTDASDETLTALSETELAVETSIRHANHDTEMSDDEREEQIGEDIGGLETQLNEQFNAKSAQVNIGDEDVNEGIRFWQYPYNDLEMDVEDSDPPPGLDCDENPDQQGCLSATDPGLLDNADGVRSFTMGVTGNDLADDEDEAFTVEFTDSTDVYIKNDESEQDQIVISEVGNDESECEVHASEDQPAVIAFTHGTVNGETCSALPGTENIEMSGFNNGEEIEASLDLVADATESDVDDEFDVMGGPSEETEEIEAHDAVYSVEVPVTITTENGELSTTVRVAPNLPQSAVEQGGE